MGAIRSSPASSIGPDAILFQAMLPISPHERRRLAIQIQNISLFGISVIRANFAGGTMVQLTLYQIRML
jgi:hypothetical protein